MKTLKNYKKIVALSALAVVLPLLVLAAPATPGPARGSGSIPSASINSVQSILDTVCIVFGWLFYFLIALSVVFIILAAYQYLTAGGNSEKVRGATRVILYAAIAVGVALLARAIPVIVASFLGADGSNIGNCSTGGGGGGGGGDVQL